MVGLYASAGTGKSFIMNKLVAQLKYANLLQNIQGDRALDCKERSRQVQELGKLLEEDDEDTIGRLWEHEFHGAHLNTGRVTLGSTTTGRQHWKNDNTRRNMAGSTEENTGRSADEGFYIFEELFYFFIVWLYLFCRCSSCCCSYRFPCCKRRAEEKPEEKPGDPTPVEYEFVWFNAWLYNGSDNLWAALILELYRTVEKHYGSEYTYAKRRAVLWGLVFKVVLTLIPVGVGLAITGRTEMTLPYDKLCFAAGHPPLLATVASFYNNVIAPLSLSGALLREASTSEFQSELGFMGKVRNRLSLIGKLLQDPTSVPTTWDFFLSEKWVPQRLRTWILEHFNQKCYGGRQSCRFVVFVDDLDGCDPDKCVEVLSAINLMCEGLPFVMILAVDLRVVVCAIEASRQGFYNNV